MIKFLRSYPVLSLCSRDKLFQIEPSANTTSRPRHKFLVLPYLSTLTPPAFVARFPPIWAVPSEARERGNILFASSAASLKLDKITPASTVITFSSELRERILFIRSKDNRIPEGPLSCICPPTKPVPPPYGIIGIFFALAKLTMTETSLTF